MAHEIEHKYLVINDTFLEMSSESHHIMQGYLSRVPERVVRIRLLDDRGFITVKGKNHGDTRLEFEYEIPVKDARQMLNLCEGKIIDKTRYMVPFEGFMWEVDRFTSPVDMTVAEIELPTSDTAYPLPPFFGPNVTGDPRYYNSNL